MLSKKTVGNPPPPWSKMTLLKVNGRSVRVIALPIDPSVFLFSVSHSTSKCAITAYVSTLFIFYLTILFCRYSLTMLAFSLSVLHGMAEVAFHSMAVLFLD